nr:hypothetical protein [Nocardia alni]
MTETTGPEVGTTRRMLSKVPEVTMWFWVIKVLCTTVGETFADWINALRATMPDPATETQTLTNLLAALG